MPLTNPYAGSTGDAGMDAANSLAAASVPKTVSVKTPTKFGRAVELVTGGAYDPTGGEDTTTPPASGKLTKWGMLTKLIGPALQGGLIGLAGGKGHPGGGFGAAQDYFDRQRVYQMQYTLLARQLQNDAYRNSLEAARTQHTLNQPNFTGRGAAPIKGRDENGNLVYMRPNPQTGVYEPIEGITPDETDNSRLEMTDQGLVSANPRTATAKRVTIPLLPSISSAVAQSTESTPTGNIAPTEFDSGSPRIPLTPGTGAASQSPSGVKAAASQGGIPLRPPNYGKPKPVIRASRNAAGVEQDHMIDTDPDSPTFGQDLGAVGTSRQPIPDRTLNRENTRDAQKAADIVRSEQYAAAALAKNSGDPDKAIQYLNGLKLTDPKAAKDFNRLLPQIRKSITDRAKSRKPKAKNPFGMSDQDWNALTAPAQPNQVQPEQ